jgi:tRNA-dihydrouridine synthase
VQERVDAARRHLERSIEWKGQKLGVLEMRRHYTNYFKGFRNIKEGRGQLVTQGEPDEIFAILNQIESHYSSADLLA